MASRLCGTITGITSGQIHAQINVLWKEIPLSVIITKTSCDDLHLSIGDTISVLIKGTDVMLAKSFSGTLSARNKVKGTVKKIVRGDVLSKIFVESQGDILHAFITSNSLKEMDIREGDEITAVVKSTELIVSKDF